MQVKRKATSIAVIGAGLSGLTAAQTLSDAGIDVTVFEKSRGVGGRTANRRSEYGSFDHGAQYFTVKDKRFRNFTEDLVSKGVIASWSNPDDPSSPKVVYLKNGKICRSSVSNEKYVGTPAMNSICKHLSDGIEIIFNARVLKVSERFGKLSLCFQDDDKVLEYDGVIISTPSLQAAALIEEWPTLSKALGLIEMHPCWACLATFRNPLTAHWVGAFLEDSHIGWIGRNSTKPDRNSNTEDLVIHATTEWSRANIAASRDVVSEILLEELWSKTGLNKQPSIYLNSHLWRYAIAARELNVECLNATSSNLVICGDWAHGSRIEGAFLSGLSASNKMLQKL